MARRRRISVSALLAQNQRLWDTAHFSQRMSRKAQKVAQRLVEPRAKAVYKALERDTGVPWWVIAVIHEREASQRWSRSLAQGDRWDRKSVNHPAGRGPFSSFHAAGVDALVNCAPHAARWKDWSAGGALTLLGLYNGTGYETYHNMPSPYVWSGTQHYRRGLYVRDGHFDPNVIDPRPGVALLLHEMARLDSSVRFIGEADEHEPEPADDTPLSPKAGSTEVPLPKPKPVDGFEPKSLIKSKIAWVLGFFGVSNASQLLSDGRFSDLAFRLMQNPRFLLLLATLIAVGAGWYFYWHDHGKGSVQ